MNSTARTIAFWMLMIVLAVVLWKMASTGGPSARTQDLNYSQFLAELEKGNVRDVTIALSQISAEVSGEMKEGGDHFRVTIPKESLPELSKLLRDKGVVVNVKEALRGDWLALLVNVTPVLIFVGLWIFMIRQMQAGGYTYTDWLAG